MAKLKFLEGIKKLMGKGNQKDKNLENQVSYGYFSDFQRARNISKAIEKRIGLGKEIEKRIGLGKSFYFFGDPRPCYLNTHSSAVFALLDYTLGNEQRARKIRDSIEQRIGFDGGVSYGGIVKSSVRHGGIETEPNVTFALLDYALGNEQRAKKIIEEIYKNIGFKQDLVRRTTPQDLTLYDNYKSVFLCTYPNAMLSLAHYVLGNEQRARNIKESIKKRIGFDKDLVPKGLEVFDVPSFSLFSGGINIQRMHEEYAGFSNYSSVLPKLNLDANAAFGLLCVAEKFKEILDRGNRKG